MKATAAKLPDFPPGIGYDQVSHLIEARTVHLIRLVVDDLELSPDISVGPDGKLRGVEDGGKDDHIWNGRTDGGTDPRPARRALMFMVRSHAMGFVHPLCYFLCHDVNHGTIAARMNQVVSVLQSYEFTVLSCCTDDAPAKKLAFLGFEAEAKVPVVLEDPYIHAVRWMIDPRHVFRGLRFAVANTNNPIQLSGGGVVDFGWLRQLGRDVLGRSITAPTQDSSTSLTNEGTPISMTESLADLETIDLLVKQFVEPKQAEIKQIEDKLSALPMSNLAFAANPEVLAMLAKRQRIEAELVSLDATIQYIKITHKYYSAFTSTSASYILDIKELDDVVKLFMAWKAGVGTGFGSGFIPKHSFEMLIRSIDTFKEVASYLMIEYDTAVSPRSFSTDIIDSFFDEIRADYGGKNPDGLPKAHEFQTACVEYLHDQIKQRRRSA
ncbi:hypothetical protein H9P43_000371 [Blastocladiella emersonii ATCC 22665]|nr:hypothetical protein H9P43_000371 [Blastocladiella emersonii ATCC 22665]